MQRCEKLTNHMEGVHINKGRSRDQHFHLQSSSEAVISRVENIYEESLITLFKRSKVSEYIVDVKYFLGLSI